ncbi:hypothetical protein DAPPUDRAFT_220721 [Daphnia pulex]|uniref:Uncharacterized protein n=1 Tax=Daphnia pulex TaxID=6669 RepID=E9FVB7_DAPPU|nr:hypothetical protein DAPPUDRAFT_220721 [Daphnia pulex]|eukprot:EFX89138.1 hypothetical protein DAPPUDRAFT_220721 [Daphnia pulex]
MRFTLACLLVVGAVAIAYAEAQAPESSIDPSGESATDGRSFYTVTLTFSTSTSFTTTTKTTTCTTSTAGLSICTASGRRRRGLHLSGNKEGRGLFYNDHEENSDDGSIFLPSPVKPAEPEPVVDADAESIRVERAPVAIPYVIQPGFDAPSNIQARVLLAFSTVTTTSTSTTTTTTSLTAICQSTTGFQVCGSNGK